MGDSIQNGRNIKLDLIRFSGVLIIMIAHSNPPSWLFQLRNFGTPLLILGSAVTYSFIYRNRAINKKEFLKKKIEKTYNSLMAISNIFLLIFLDCIINNSYELSIFHNDNN